MKNSRFLPTFFTLALLFAVMSCRDDNNSTLQPKPNKQRGARAVGNSDYNNWNSSLSWTQQNWIDQQLDPEDFAYTLWSDEMSISADLVGKGISTDISVNNIFHCYQIALAGAHHSRSIGATKAQQWIQMTYIDGVGYGTETLYNFNVGKQFALSNPAVTNLGDGVYKNMFIDHTNFKVPGITVIGIYRDVRIYKNPLLDISGTATLPGENRQSSGIYLQSVYADNLNSQATQDLIRHEFGHILQKEQLGILCFYTEIAINSSISASQNGVNGYQHQCYYTETDANRRSKSFHQINEPGYVWQDGTYLTSCPNYGSETPCR